MTETENDIQEEKTEEEARQEAPTETEGGERFENAAEATNFETTGKGGPSWFNRKNVMVAICFVFVFIVSAGLIFSSSKNKKKKLNAEDAARTARVPKEFLSRELEKSLETPDAPSAETELPGIENVQDFNTLPQVTPVNFTETRAAELRRDDMPQSASQRGQSAPPPSGAYQSGGGGGSKAPPFTANRASLVPQVEGNLFGAPVPAKNGGGGTYAEKYPYMEGGGGMPAGYSGNPYPAGGAGYGGMAGAMPEQGPYAAQNNQADKKAFYNSGYSSGGISGTYIGEDALWTGTIIPAVLETAVNTDLPGNVLARVSQNVYDTRSGMKLLIPQGSILVAKYNSSVSYAQHRVQIVWDLLIRPDGYQIELEGMNGVDAKGMSGIPAEFHENWFEYLKAAGIITMFSVANSKMAEEAAKYGSAETAAGVTASNAEFVNQIGGNIVSRAMNIQPTLTVNNGEKVNVMINKTVFLPPMENIEVSQKYILK